MSKPLRKAVLPVAGLGTRFLPATKATAKEMLPVLRDALMVAGRLLARGMSSPDQSDRFH